MSTKSKVDEAGKWYIENRPRYESLAKHVENILKIVLKQHKVNYHSITSRAKDVEKYIAKASKTLQQETLPKRFLT